MADTDYKQNGATSIISMLGSIVSALGFEITDNAKATVNMLQMQRDLMLDSTMKDYLTGEYTLKTLQNIATGAWYVPGKLVSWVQKWLANNGGYGDSATYDNTTVNVGDEYEYYGIYGTSLASTLLRNVERAVLNELGVEGYRLVKGSIGTTTYNSDKVFDVDVSLYPIDARFYAANMVSFKISNSGTTKGFQKADGAGGYVKWEVENATKVISGTAYCNLSGDILDWHFTPGIYDITNKQFGSPIFSGVDAEAMFRNSSYYYGLNIWVFAKGSMTKGGGITRGGGVGRHHYSLPQDENFPPCGGDTTVPQITEWSGRVINWNNDCYMPLTYFKVNPSNENPGTEPGSPNTPIEPEDPRLDPESPNYDPSIPNVIIKYFYPEDYVQSTPQNGDNTVQTSGQLQDNFTNANNGPSNIPNTDIKGGLYTLWHPSADNLQKLGAFLYGGTTQGTIASIIGDPINAIIQLTEWAVTPVDGPVKSPVICNIGATELKMPTIPNQFMQFDCGTIEIPREYHDFRDYEPYTRLSLFLPFVGDVNISTNDCITPHKIHVIYNIDFLSGVACAEVLIDEDVRYAYQAAMCAAIPVTSSDASRLLASLIGAAVGAVGGGVMGGIVGGTAGSRMVASSLIGGVSEAALSPINGIQTQRTGSISANTGLLGEMKPYVLVTRPISVVAKQYKSLLGQPYQLDGTLGSQKGFVKVREVHLDGIMATEAEKTEIEQMLKEGVIL